MFLVLHCVVFVEPVMCGSTARIFECLFRALRCRCAHQGSPVIHVTLYGHTRHKGNLEDSGIRFRCESDGIVP